MTIEDHQPGSDATVMTIEREANEGENCLHCLVTPLQQNLPLILRQQDVTHTSMGTNGGLFW